MPRVTHLVSLCNFWNYRKTGLCTLFPNCTGKYYYLYKYTVIAASYDVILSELSADAPEFQPESIKKKQEAGKEKEQVMLFLVLSTVYS